MSVNSYICGLMKRLSSILILFVVFALAGKTAVTAFCPEVLPVSGVACDWAEESSEEDESEEDDKALHHGPGAAVSNIAVSNQVEHPECHLKTMTLEIIAPPPQA